MTVDTGLWLSRGRELRCFRGDSEAMDYLFSFEAGDVAAVQWELERIFAGPHRMPVVNWLAFSSFLTSTEMALEDGPRKFVEDLIPADFEIRPWGGGTTHASRLSGATLAEWDSFLVDASRAFLFVGKREKGDLARAMAKEVRRAHDLRPVPLSGLVRAATAARFIGLAGPGSAQLAQVVPDYGAIGAMWPALRERAERVVALWAATLGAAAAGTPPYPLTLHALRTAESTVEIKTRLEAATSAKNRNLMKFLACEDFD